MAVKAEKVRRTHGSQGASDSLINISEIGKLPPGSLHLQAQPSNIIIGVSRNVIRTNRHDANSRIVTGQKPELRFNMLNVRAVIAGEGHNEWTPLCKFGDVDDLTLQIR
jgi:hypothetical protein